MKQFKRFKLSYYLLCTSLLFLAILSAIAFANKSDVYASDTVVIQPGGEGKDAYIFGGMGMQGNNYGDTTYLEAGGGSGTPPAARSFIQFDLSSIPSGASIESATLWLYYYGWFGPNDLSIDLSAKRVTSSWDEHTITWNLQPSIDASAQDTTTFGTSASYGWYSFNIKTLTENWFNGSYSNYGLVIDFPDSTPNNAKVFYSSDETTQASLRPKLSVTYTAGSQPEVTHKACVSNICQTVSGAGVDSCSNDNQCQATTPPAQTTTHRACQNQKCVSVSGSGNDECSNDTMCIASDGTTDDGEEPSEGSVTEEINQNLSTTSKEGTKGNTSSPENASKVEKFINNIADSQIPIVPVVAAGALSVASAAISFWAFLSAEMTAKEYLLALINYIITLFTAKNKNKQGKVYDATTKKPVRGALVNIYKYPEMRLIASALSDLLGRFYFVAQKGKYVMSASSRGFIFPSQQAKKELLYSNSIYVGQTIELNDADVINYDIPLDPSSKIKTQSNSLVRLILLSNVTRLIIMFGGTIISTLILWYQPQRMNYIILVAYLILWLMELLIESRDVKFSRVLEAGSGDPIDLALVRVAAKDGKLLQTYVSDHLGRVAIKSEDPSNLIMVERSGYKRIEHRANYRGFIEGKKFYLEKIA